jgi:predicted metal-dependent hydrolase
MSKQQITYGTSIINFSISYSNRKTLGIAVYPDSKVHITAPLNAPMDIIHKRLERKASWILKKIRRYSRMDIVHREIEWVSGETMYYLGRQYRLKIQKGVHEIKLSGKLFVVTIPEKNDHETIKKLVTLWYKKQALLKLSERIEKQTNLLQREKVKINRLIIRKLSKRWGSCSNKGNIILNIDLVKVPIDCIDYVIIHEICHLKYLNHGKKFYQTLEKNCPDWLKKKDRLNRFAANY